MTLISSESNVSVSFSSTDSSANNQQSVQERVFYRLIEAVGHRTAAQNQFFTLTLAGETSQFTRFS